MIIALWISPPDKPLVYFNGKKYHSTQEETDQEFLQWQGDCFK
jgi:hypothetical protein